MKDLVPIKVKITLNTAGAAKYPSFNALSAVQQSGMDWSKYIDTFGSGWLYDCCGHKEEEAGSPAGQQWGMILVPKVFADEAVAKFPNECSKLTEAEAEDFYDKKHARDQRDEEIDVEVLQGIKLKQDLNIPLTKQQQDAINPVKEERGVRKNKNKKFTDYKQKRGFRVVQ